MTSFSGQIKFRKVSVVGIVLYFEFSKGNGQKLAKLYLYNLFGPLLKYGVFVCFEKWAKKSHFWVEWIWVLGLSAISFG